MSDLWCTGTWYQVGWIFAYDILPILKYCIYLFYTTCMVYRSLVTFTEISQYAFHTPLNKSRFWYYRKELITYRPQYVDAGFSVSGCSSSVGVRRTVNSSNFTISYSPQENKLVLNHTQPQQNNVSVVCAWNQGSVNSMLEYWFSTEVILLFIRISKVFLHQSIVLIGCSLLSRN